MPKLESPPCLPMQMRALPITSVNAQDRTVEVVWSTGAAVRRYDWWNDEYYDETLSLDPTHVDLNRLNNGAPLLDTHERGSLADQIGVVEKAWLAGGEGRALVRFSSRDDVEPIWRDVAAGIIRNISVGYNVRTYTITRTAGDVPVYLATDWEPTELSFVPIGADAGAGVRAEAPGGAPCRYIETSPPVTTDEPEDHPAPAGFFTDQPTREDPMPQTATPATEGQTEQQIRDQATAQERTRQAEIRRYCRAASLDDQTTEGLIDSGASLEAARAQILDAVAQRADAQPQSRGHVQFQTVQDEADVRREAIAAAVMHRAGQLRELPEAAREYRGLTLPELARHALEKQGINTRGMSRNAMIVRSLHTTSDFSVALGSAAERTLRNAYQVAPKSFTTWARKGTVPDFRAYTRVAVSGDMVLEKQGEHGEIKRGYLSDTGELIQLSTYSKSIGITRQAIINDDLGIFSRIPMKIVQDAIATESSLVYGILTGNPAMSDGVALFHANHANLSGTGAAISVASLGAARAAMRLQKAPTSKEPLNLQPKYLVVPAALETLAQQFISQNYLAAKNADYNPFAGSLELIVEPRLDAASTTAWYLAADPNVIDTIEYSYLDGAEGLQTQQRDGYSSGSDIDGIEILAYLDFAAKAIDHRGLYKQPGA